MSDSDITNLTEIFPDTNILMHYRAFDGLDWKTLCNTTGGVRLHISQSLLKELNDLKDSGKTHVIRKRASTALRTLRELHNGKRVCPNGIEIHFSSVSPDISHFHGLNSHVQDDQLIAAILTHKKAHPKLRIFLATADGGLGLIVKCGDQGIEWIEPPEEMKLPPEASPLELENQKLRKENESLRLTHPSPQVGFTSDSNRLDFGDPGNKPMTDVQKIMRDLKEKYPSMKTRKDFAAVQILSGYDLFNSPEKISKYNIELEEFFQSYQKSIEEILSKESRTIFFSLVVHNIGTAPANDLRINIHFPDGFTLISEGEWNKRSNLLPTPPDRPDRPFRGIENIGSLLAPARYQLPQVISPTSFSIRKTNSYDITFKHIKLQQHESHIIQKFALTFDGSPFSFNATWHITADNLPNPILGDLHFHKKEI